MPLNLGSSLGHYDVTALIGEGEWASELGSFASRPEARECHPNAQVTPARSADAQTNGRPEVKPGNARRPQLASSY